MVDKLLRKWAKDAVAHSKTTTGLERLLGSERWARLQKTNETYTSPEAIMARADTVMETLNDTLRQRFGDLSPSHMVGLDFRGEDGILHRLADSKGRPAFENVFDVEFWTRPQGGDLTIRDDLKLLPVELREPNFGLPTKKPEEKPPGVV